MQNEKALTLGPGDNTQQQLEAYTRKVRLHNDWFRETGTGGVFVLKPCVVKLGSELIARAIECIKTYHYYIADDSWGGEHDYGEFGLLEDQHNPRITINWDICWRISYRDSDRKFGSIDPSDPETTTREMTVYLKSER